MRVDQILKDAANKLMGWPIPKSFFPDGGISFDGRKDDEWNTNKPWPIGTNLLCVDQAHEMFEYCLKDALAKVQEAHREEVKKLSEKNEDLSALVRTNMEFLKEAHAELDALSNERHARWWWKFWA